MSTPTTFWDDLASDLRDPEFLLAYLATTSELQAVQILMASTEGDD